MHKKLKELSKRCSWHKPANLSLLDSSADAEERLAKGERQRMCPECIFWYWDHEWGSEPAGLNHPVIRAEDEDDHSY